MGSSTLPEIAFDRQFIARVNLCLHSTCSIFVRVKSQSAGVDIACNISRSYAVKCFFSFAKLPAVAIKLLNVD